jgi:flagellar biosynthesis chaperone FliJ
MPRDALAVLWRLRDAAVTEARRNLAAALASESQAARRLNEHHAQTRHEQAQAAVEHVAQFAEWLPYARQRADQLQAALMSEQARVQHLRQLLTGRRTEAETVAKAMQRQRQAAELIQARKEQAVMDEAGGRRTLRPGIG